MIKKGVVEIVLVVSQLVNTKELTRYFSQVSLKEKENTNLKEDKKAMERSNKEYQDKNSKLKDRLMGKSVLQLARHSLWDLIGVEVIKFWGELKRLEAKKAYIYLALEKCRRANE